MKSTRIAALCVLAAVTLGASAVQNALAAPDKAAGPVTVVNPATQPALTSSVDDPGRAPYQSGVTGLVCQSGSPLQDGGWTCIANFPAVPAGHRLVIQHVSIGFSNAASAFGVLTDGVHFNIGAHFSAAPPWTFGGGLVFADQPVLLYADEGRMPRVTITTFVGNANSPQGEVALMGYLLDCSAAPCKPIAGGQ
jgi:hypothetical protein